MPLGFRRMKAMARHRSHSIEFKRQVAQEFIAGETLHALARRHDVSRNLIRVWVKKIETGAFDDDALAADLQTRSRPKRQNELRTEISFRQGPGRGMTTVKIILPQSYTWINRIRRGKESLRESS